MAAAGAAVFSACVAAMRDRPEFTASLARSMRGLRSLASPSAADSLQASLKGLPIAFDSSRASLDGSRRGFRSVDIMRIASCLQAVPPGTVLRLNLSHTPFSIDAAAAFAVAHTMLSALCVLRLRGCDLGDGGAELICSALHHPAATASAPLNELALASNALGLSAAGAIAEAVRELPDLLTLDLSYNGLGSSGCVAIAEAIGECRMLQSLSLASVGLDDVGTVRLASALSTVPLAELDLDGNAASDAAMGALLGMAARSGTLNTLRLSANAVGEAGAGALALHLTSRPSGALRTVALANNPLGAAGGEALTAAARANSMLVELSLVGAGLTSNQSADIQSSIERNRKAARHESRQQTRSLLRKVGALVCPAPRAPTPQSLPRSTLPPLHLAPLAPAAPCPPCPQAPCPLPLAPLPPQHLGPAAPQCVTP